jgi:hypothetical protein
VWSCFRRIRIQKISPYLDPQEGYRATGNRSCTSCPLTEITLNCHRFVVVTDDAGQGDFAALAAKVQHDIELGSRRKLRSMKEDICQMRKKEAPPV